MNKYAALARHRVYPNQCDKKFGFARVAWAEKAIENMTRDGKVAGKLHPYWCRVCANWHVGHDRS